MEGIEFVPIDCDGFYFDYSFLELKGEEMKKFDFTIKRRGLVFIKVDNRVNEFLQQAKENGYRFGDGKIITLQDDEKSFHYALTQDNKLYRLSALCWLTTDKVDRFVF